tara:strand:+ start:27 stop:818 length:792 start_codon:yes stop_codon:yes gene_type:complete
MKKESDIPIIIAGYARSGQGWLSYMLSYILNARFIEPYCLLRGIVYSGNPYITGLTQGNLEGREKTKYSMIVKTHNLPDPFFSLTDKVIIVARDPRDVAVSALDRNIARQKTGTDLTDEDRSVAIVNINRRDLIESIKNWLWSKKLICYFFSAYKWRHFYKEWDDVGVSLKVTYEDISLYPKETLCKILKYLEIDINEDLIEEAIQKFSFEVLSGRNKGDEEKGHTSFRKGIVGDYKHNLNSFHNYLIKNTCGKIAKKWGYNK